MSEEKFRVESDLLGELKVPINAYYGVQTQRGINNYHISRKKMRDYPDYVVAIAYVKLAAVQTNHSLGVIRYLVPSVKPVKRLLTVSFTRISL